MGSLTIIKVWSPYSFLFSQVYITLQFKHDLILKCRFVVLNCTYQVALESNKFHPCLEIIVGGAAQALDELHQVYAELVASL